MSWGLRKTSGAQEEAASPTVSRVRLWVQMTLPFSFVNSSSSSLNIMGELPQTPFEFVSKGTWGCWLSVCRSWLYGIFFWDDRHHFQDSITVEIQSNELPNPHVELTISDCPPSLFSSFWHRKKDEISPLHGLCVWRKAVGFTVKRINHNSEILSNPNPRPFP